MLWPLGIDIAKRSFEVVLLPPTGKPKHHRFANDPAGHQELLTWLRQQGVPQVYACLEATGTYGQALARFLHAHGHQVSLVNPRAIYHFAQSQLKRAKTDRLDAALLAHYCRERQATLRPWTPPPAAFGELTALLRRVEDLEQLRQMERNRQAAEEARGGAGASATVAASLTAHLTYLEEALQQLWQAIRAHIEQHPELKQQRELLLSIPGIGESTAVVLLAELPVRHCRDARAAAAFAGLTPEPRESGDTPGGPRRLCKVGSSRLRKALYFPAVAALRHNPVIRAFGERLRARGKAKMLVIGAAMRKLVHLAYGVLKSGKPFSPELASA